MRTLGLAWLVALALGGEVVAPEKGSPEEALRESLILIKAGNAVGWMDTWCTPGKCASTDQRLELQAYMLKQALVSSKNCLHGESDALQIKSVKGNPETDARLSITLVCSHTAYPPPAVLEKVDGKWYVTTIPW